MTKDKRANGGKARAKKLTPERRKEIAKAAAAARWGSMGLSTSLKLKRTKAPKVKRKDRTLANWREIVSPEAVQHGKGQTGTLRDQIAFHVLTGLYSDIGNAQKFAAHLMGAEMLLPEAFTRIAYAQADEVLRLRAL